MQCESFSHRLNQLLDRHGRPHDDALLAEHAARCSTCREAFDVQSSLFDTIRDWSVADLEVDLVDRVMARVGPPAKRDAPRPAEFLVARLASAKRLRRVGLGLAAAVAVAFCVWQGAAPGAKESPKTLPESSQIVTSRPPAAKRSSPEPELTDAQIAALARRLGQRVSEFGRMAQEIGLPEPVAAGLRPLRHTMAAAYDALRKTLSVKNDQPASRSSSWQSRGARLEA